MSVPNKPVILLVAVIFFMLASFTSGQKLPDKIRGYKVYDTKISVTSSAGEQSSKKEKQIPLVKLGKPLIDFNGLLSIAVEAGAEITSPAHSGKIDFLTFHDIRINDVPVEIDEYTTPFSIRKDTAVSLPKPFRLTIGIAGLAKAGYQEFIEPKKEWSVTGTAFVFGRFKKFGFGFKRVVPIKIDMKIKNPLAD